MMGYINKGLYHSYVYNILLLLIIWEICQDNKFVIFKNLCTYLNLEDALVKLTDGVWWADWCSGETDWWGLVRLIDAMVKLTDGVWWWGVVKWTSIGYQMGYGDELEYGLLMGETWDDIGSADELFFGYADEGWQNLYR